LLNERLGSIDEIYPAIPADNSFLIAKIEYLAIRKPYYFDEQYTNIRELTRVAGGEHLIAPEYLHVEKSPGID